MTAPLGNLFPWPACVSEEARSMAIVVRSWAQREILSQRPVYRQRYDELFPSQRHILSHDLGLRGLLLPEDLEGAGWNRLEKAPDAAALLLEVGRADAAQALSLALDNAVTAAVAIEPHLDRALCETIAEALGSENDGALALILPGAGRVGVETPLFLGLAISTRLGKEGGKPVASGENLRPLGAGLDAALLGVVCADAQGIPALALLSGQHEGIRRGAKLATTGIEALANCDLDLKNVPVGKGSVMVGELGIKRLVLWLDLLLGAASVGAAMGFWEMLIDFVEPKVIKGGSPLKENPLCAAVLAFVAEEILCAHQLLFDLAEMIAADEGAAQTPSERAFAYGQLLGGRIQRGALAAIDRGMELMGSAGYAKEWHTEKHWRDVKTIGSWRCGLGAEVPAQMNAARYFFEKGATP